MFAGDPVLAGVERLLAEVDRLCAVSPVVLVAEDLQWADEASVLVWSRLSRAVGQMPLLLAGSCDRGRGAGPGASRRRGVGARSGGRAGAGAVAGRKWPSWWAGWWGRRPGGGWRGGGAGRGQSAVCQGAALDGLVRRAGRGRGRQSRSWLAESALVQVPVSLAAAIGERLAGIARGRGGGTAVGCGAGRGVLGDGPGGGDGAVGG